LSDLQTTLAKGCAHVVFLMGLEEQLIVLDLPRQIRRILFVCKGNICRSPFAASYFEAQLNQHMPMTQVMSAGLETTVGKQAHPLAKTIARKYGLSLDRHITTPLVRNHVIDADLILVMETGHRLRLIRMYPEAERKVFHLGYFNGKTLTEIADPYSGTVDDFEHCFTLIRHCCENLLRRIKAASSATAY
jgi:protein-tyrosine-phosphatase